MARLLKFWHSVLAALHAERGRWFNWVPVAFGAGIGAYFALPAEPALAAAALPLVLGSVVLSLVRIRDGARLIAMSLVIAGAGFLVAKVRASLVEAPAIARTMRGAEVQGFVERIEPKEPRGERLTIRVTALAGLAAEALPKRIRVRTLAAASKGPERPLRPGDHVRIKATLEPPSQPALPGDYDFARSAWFQGIGAVGYTFEKPLVVPAPRQRPLTLEMQAAIEGLRGEIGLRILAVLPGETGALATALITGDRGAISPETIEAYRGSGLIHMLSISGLHMAVMAGAVFFAIRALLACVPTLALHHPIKKWAAVGGMAATLGYLAISGGSAATVRSAVMMLVVFLAILFGRPAIALRNVAISALVILAIWPESLLDVGFQMSFAAVVALVAAYEAWGEWWARDPRPIGLLGRALGFVAGIAGSTFVAGFAVAPLGIYHFHASQQYAALANVIAIPVSNFVVMPAALATLVAMPLGLEGLPLAVMGAGIDAISWTAHWVAALPGATARVAAISDWGMTLMMAGGLWLCLWRARWRLLGLPVVVTGIAIAPLTKPPDILAGRDGTLIAVRQADGRLAAAGLGSGGGFELSRWLEHEGDARKARDVKRAAGFRCDGAGCVARSGSLVVAASRHPASLADDCRRAEIVILDRRLPGGCDGPRLVLDREDFRAGTHAIWHDADGQLRVVSVDAARGSRPWVKRHDPARDSHYGRPNRSSPKRDQERDGDSRLADFSAPRELVDAGRAAHGPNDELAEAIGSALADWP